MCHSTTTALDIPSLQRGYVGAKFGLLVTWVGVNLPGSGGQRSGKVKECPHTHVSQFVLSETVIEAQSWQAQMELKRQAAECK